MSYQSLFKVIDESGLSYEKFGERMGVSGMTLRRWRNKPPNEALPLFYEKPFAEVVLALVSEGLLKDHSKEVTKVLENKDHRSFQVVLKSLGISEEMLSGNAEDSDKFLLGLTQIGNDGARRQQVDENQEKILSYQKHSSDWKTKISRVMRVVRSKKLTSFDKLLAYGSLFYLITTFDLIPDTIPGFGLIDDFMILGSVAAHYFERFPEIFKD